MEEEQGTRSHLLTQKHTKRLTGNWFKALSPLSLRSVQNFNVLSFLLQTFFSVNIFKPLKAHRRIYINIKILATLFAAITLQMQMQDISRVLS